MTLTTSLTERDAAATWPKQSSSAHSPWRWYALAVITLLVQVLPYFSYRWVTDESWYTGPGYSIAHGHGIADPAIGPNDIENHFDARPPGTALVIAGFFKLFGAGASQARGGSLVAAVLALLATWRIASLLFGVEGAAVTAFVMATDNFLVASARTARPEALTTMAVVLAMLCTLHYARPGGKLPYAVLAGMTIAGAAMFHITVLGYVISLGLLAIVSDRRNGRFVLRGAAVYTAGFFAGLIPFGVWILSSPLGKAGFRAEYLARTQETLLMKLLHEGKRYGDMLGLHQLHTMPWLPVRLPIPLFFLAATILLWKYRRNWFYLELLLLLPTLGWFIETANKSSRYLALLSPLVSLAIGGAITICIGRRWLKPAISAVAVLIAMQFGSNLILLRAASRADYTRVGSELRSVIPADQAAYATITFWLALHDQPFISYERTTPRMAEQQYGVHYFVLGDRMMTQGEPWDAKFYADMNAYLAALTARSELVGEFPDPYYGDLRVYRTR